MNRMMMSAIAMLALAAAQPVKADDTQHFVGPATTANGSVSLEAFNARIESSAKALLAKFPPGTARDVQSDEAFPVDLTEYRAFGGQGILLIGAIVRDPSELPVKRVYLLADGREIELERVARFAREVPKGSAEEEAYGDYREDSFYLVPVEYLDKSPQVLCDFAVNRDGFVISRDFLAPPSFIADISDKSKGADPSPEALRAFLDREYPGMMGAP